MMTNKGIAGGVLLKTLSNSICPHSDNLNGQDEVKWQFKVDEDNAVWKEAEHFGIFTAYGRSSVHHKSHKSRHILSSM